MFFRTVPLFWRGIEGEAFFWGPAAYHHESLLRRTLVQNNIIEKLIIALFFRERIQLKNSVFICSIISSVNPSSATIFC